MPGPETRKLICDETEKAAANGGRINGFRGIAITLASAVGALLIGIGTYLGSSGKLPNLANAGLVEISPERARQIARQIAREELEAERRVNTVEHRRIEQKIDSNAAAAAARDEAILDAIEDLERKLPE